MLRYDLLKDKSLSSFGMEVLYIKGNKIVRKKRSYNINKNALKHLFT